MEGGAKTRKRRARPAVKALCSAGPRNSRPSRQLMARERPISKQAAWSAADFSYLDGGSPAASRWRPFEVFSGGFLLLQGKEWFS